VFGAIYRFRDYLRPYRWALGAGVVFTLLDSVFALAQPWPLKVIVDNVLRHKRLSIPGAQALAGLGRQELLLAAIVAYLLIGGLSALFDYLGTLLSDGTGERLVADIRAAVFARLQRLSLRFHSSQRTGDLVSRVIADIDRVDDMLIQAFSVLVPNVAFLVGMVVVMFLLDPLLTLVSLAVSPFLFASIFHYTRRIRGSARLARKQEGRLAARTGEVLGAIRVVQAFTGEDFEEERFTAESSETLAASLQTVRLQARFSPLVDSLAAIGIASVLYVGTRQVLAGTLSLGLLLVFLNYVGSMYKPMRQLSKLAVISSRGVASAERVSEVLEAEIDVRDLPGAKKAPPFQGRIEFEDVYLSYDGRRALEGIQLTGESGQVIALVGPTGAGKSSLVSLIPRFVDPQRGRVLIDDRDVKSMRLRSLRSQIAIVLQEPVLFQGTLYDNVAYANPKASGAEVRRAAKAALVDEIVRGLPDGFATVIGERGATLSGGERQRISIARALLRKAPILILDEPTSGLDPASEMLLLRALRELTADRTTFVIAHRMSTVSGADLVVVLDQGKVLETGTHDELLRAHGGLYRSFLELQMQGFEQRDSAVRGRASRRQPAQSTGRGV
jgi:subfamily B ATP-binding cassette protein MsbA